MSINININIDTLRDVRLGVRRLTVKVAVVCSAVYADCERRAHACRCTGAQVYSHTGIQVYTCTGMYNTCISVQCLLLLLLLLPLPIVRCLVPAGRSPMVADCCCG